MSSCLLHQHRPVTQPPSWQTSNLLPSSVKSEWRDLSRSGPPFERDERLVQVSGSRLSSVWPKWTLKVCTLRLSLIARRPPICVCRRNDLKQVALAIDGVNELRTAMRFPAVDSKRMCCTKRSKSFFKRTHVCCEQCTGPRRL